MKHIKIFENFNSQGLKVEDVSVEGDTIYCWNFEDYWEVALVSSEWSDVLEKYIEETLEENGNDEDGRVSFSDDPGIAFVGVGIKNEFHVGFLGPNSNQDPYEYLVGSKGESTQESSNPISNSILFALKKNHVLSFTWHGVTDLVPIDDYLDDYLDKYAKHLKWDRIK